VATWEVEIWRIEVRDQTEQIVPKTPISKITRAKWTGGVAHAVESLLCKHKALSSNPSPRERAFLPCLTLCWGPWSSQPFLPGRTFDRPVTGPAGSWLPESPSGHWGARLSTVVGAHMEAVEDVEATPGLAHHVQGTQGKVWSRFSGSFLKSKARKAVRDPRVERPQRCLESQASPGATGPWSFLPCVCG
jgi:hypothetical protein